ncbi:MAG: lipopolysaccharide biosynthesis protein [Blastocatellia bacterium]
MSWFLPIVLGFASTPILVKGLGHEIYGIYAIILGFLSYSFTFGIGKVAAKYVSEFRAAGDHEKISEVISGTLWLSLLIGFAGASVLALLTKFIVSDVLLLPENARDTAETALYLACVTGLIAMISQVFQSVLHGLHRFGNFLLLTNLNSLLLSSGNIVLALSGFGVVALIAWNLLIVALLSVIFFYTAKRYLPEFRLRFKVEKGVRNAAVKYGSSIIVYQIFGNALFIFERSWIVRRFGPEALTFYFVPMLLGIYLHGLIGSFVQVLFPVVNELLTNRERLVAIYMKATRIVMAVIVFVVTTYICSGRLFLRLWVDVEFAYRSYDLLLIHAITFGAISSIIIVWHVAEAFKAPAINIVVTAVWMLIGIPLMILAADRWATEGIAFSRMIAACVTLPVICYVEQRFLGKVFALFWLKLLGRIALATVAIVMFQQLQFLVLEGNWASLIMSVSMSVILYGLVLFVTGFFEKGEIDSLKSFLVERPGIVIS